MEPTKTQRALALVDQGMKAFAAARGRRCAECGLSRIEETQGGCSGWLCRLPLLRHLVTGEKINRDVLKDL